MLKIEIYCRGRLDASWSDWFQGLTIAPVAPGSTRLSGEVPDNAVIYGLLATMSSLGLTLISCSVAPEHADRQEQPDTYQKEASSQGFRIGHSSLPGGSTAPPPDSRVGRWGCRVVALPGKRD